MMIRLPYISAAALAGACVACVFATAVAEGATILTAAANKAFYTGQLLGRTHPDSAGRTVIT